MPLPEVFDLKVVAKHVGVSQAFVEREVRRIGCCAIAGNSILLTEEHVKELLAAWRPPAEPSRIAEPIESEEWLSNRPFTPQTLAREWQVSDTHIRNLIKKGELGHFKVGRILRISVAHAKAYQDSNRV